MSRAKSSIARRSTDRALAWLARVLLPGFYRRVEVHPRWPELGHRPVPVVSYQFDGSVDRVMLVRVLGRVPRFLAKSTLWDVVIDVVIDEAAATVP